MNISEFDVISGLSGVGAYLLCRRDQPLVAETLPVVIEVLVELLSEANGLPRWHTPVRIALGPGTEGHLPVREPELRPGARSSRGARVPVARTAGGNCHSRVAGSDRANRPLALSEPLDDEWGVNWPTAVPLVEVDSPDGPHHRSRKGRIGARRYKPLRLVLRQSGNRAGAVAGRRRAWRRHNGDSHRQLAIAAMEAVFRRPIPVRRIDSPTFCHGKAGLLEIALRFAHDTGYSMFVNECRTLAEEVLDCYQPESLLGFRNIEYADREIDQPGLLDGAPGVALVLLAAATGVEPSWDRLFLLS